MEPGNIMQIGHQILRDLQSRFAQIGEQFNLLQWVDSQFSASDLKIDAYVTTLTQSMRELSSARRSGIFTYREGVLVDFSETYNTTVGGLLLSEISGNIQRDAQEMITIEDSVASDYCRLSIRLTPNETPEIVIVLEGIYSERKVAALYEESFLATAKMVAARSSALIDNYISRTQSDQTQKITKEFLSPKAQPETKEGDSEKFEFDVYFDDRWLAIVDLFAGYFPKWAPFAFAHPPLVQVLTVEQTHSRFIILRATHGKWNVAYKPLERSKTICGLLLDKEAREGPQPYLKANPTDPDYVDRYASFLYSEIPKSELVIPIRDKNQQNKIVALINLEHPDENAFSEYHIKLALKATAIVSNFILYLIGEEEDDISDEKLFRYVIIRLIKRLSDTYLHKINNQIPVIKSALNELQKQKDEIFSGDQLEDFEDIRAGVYTLSDLSKYFLSNLSGFISFGKIHLADMIQQSVDDFDIEKLEKTENIYIKIEDVGSGMIVFGSALIREHIYNIIKNSLDQLRIRRRERNGEKAKSSTREGHISIDVSKEKFPDLRKRDSSYEFVRVSIQDDAGGIPKKHVDKVLRRGYTTKREIGGTGFGLSAAAEYMISIGGYLTLDNRIGHGLTVNLLFPVYTDGYHDILSRKLNVPIDGDLTGGLK
jgi:signal transduction histidine kinase